MKQLIEIMAKLRSPDGGCPWDLEQNFATIAPYTIEEAYEVADAIERNDPAAIEEELGDLLLQVVFHAQMASELGWFGFDDVARGISEKMVRRHPHVFGDAAIHTAEQQTASWETIKAAENKNRADGLLADIPKALPALLRAAKLQQRAARVGFDWPSAEPVWDKVNEELAELKTAMADNNSSAIAEEMGDLLFVCTNLARHAKVDAEDALRAANAKFERRFRHIEQTLGAEGRTLESATLEEMDALWNQAKAEEKKGQGDVAA